MKDNQKLKGLQGQIGEMHNDFEDMKNAREEARRILEAKFQDIYKRLEELKAALEKQAKDVNTELRNFETKFTDLLNNLKTEIYKDFEDEKTFVHGKLDEHDNKIVDLQDQIKKEREERLKQNDEMLLPLKEQISELFTKLEQEKKRKRRW